MIYVMQARDGGAVKIGFVRGGLAAIEQRRAALQIGGADLFTVGGLGAMLLMFGVVVAVIVKRWP